MGVKKSSVELEISYQDDFSSFFYLF